MHRPKKLVLGVDSPAVSPEEEESRMRVLEATLEHYLPEFCNGVKHAATDEENGTIVLHQDAFASGYDDDEYMLLGMAVKYAGLRGVNVQFIGKNHETF